MTVLSVTQDVLFGVPQGSVLVPLLCILYTSELAQTRPPAQQYADDLCATSAQCSTSQQLQLTDLIWATWRLAESQSSSSEPIKSSGHVAGFSTAAQCSPDTSHCSCVDPVVNRSCRSVGRQPRRDDRQPSVTVTAPYRSSFDS